MRIPNYAKQAAREALELRKTLPKSKQFGLSEEEANFLGITSGVKRAKQILRNYRLSKSDQKAVCSFYQRFKGKSTPKVEGAIKLWGGRKFGREVCSYIKQQS